MGKRSPQSPNLCDYLGHGPQRFQACQGPMVGAAGATKAPREGQLGDFASRSRSAAALPCEGTLNPGVSLR